MKQTPQVNHTRRRPHDGKKITGKIPDPDDFQNFMVISLSQDASLAFSVVFNVKLLSDKNKQVNKCTPGKTYPSW